MKMKKEYETPLLSVCRIEMESGFCSASAEFQKPTGETAEIKEHSINSEFSGDFSSGWDTDPTGTGSN